MCFSFPGCYEIALQVSYSTKYCCCCFAGIIFNEILQNIIKQDFQKKNGKYFCRISKISGPGRPVLLPFWPSTGCRGLDDPWRGCANKNPSCANNRTLF